MKQLYYLFLVLLTLYPVKIFAESEKFKVGVISAFTGPAASNGIAMRNSIELAQKDQPEMFKNIEFVYEDGTLDPKQALAAFLKLRDLDKVDLVYAWGVTYCKPIAPAALSSKIPVVCQGIDQESYKNNPYLIRFMNSSDQYAEILSRYIASKGFKKLGIVVAENPYMEGMFEALTRNIGKDSEIILVEKFAPGQIDAASTISKLKREKFDAIGVYLLPGQIGQFYQQMAKQKFVVSSFGTNCFENLDEIKLSGGAMEGSFYVHNEVNPSFINRYMKTFGNVSQLAFGAMAYEFAKLVGSVFHKVELPVSNEQVLSKLLEVKVVRGTATGDFKLIVEGELPKAGLIADLPKTQGLDRYFAFPFAVKEIQGTSFVPVLKSSE